MGEVLQRKRANKRTKPKNFQQIAKQYAQKVVKQKNHCRTMKLSCECFLDDLEKQKEKDFPYRFDIEKAVKICRFAELLPHVKGKWARKTGIDRLIKLEPWQVFILVNIFGWVNKKTDLRRYRQAYLKIPRKNGKSVLAAIVALYLFAVDREPGAEVYSGASSEKQAWEVFGPAKKMVERTPRFRNKFGIEVNAKSLVIPRDGSKFECLIGDPGDGSSPHCAVVDEYHEHKTDALYDTMHTGMGAREQPLMFIITTAGTDTSGPCYQYEQDCLLDLEEPDRNPERFIAIWGIDDEKEWDTIRGVKKANPNYDVSVFGEFLLSQVKNAKRSPRKQNIIKQKHFNVWTAGEDAFFNMAEWQAAGDSSLIETDFGGDDYYQALDLASKIDIASDVRIYRRNIEGQDHYYVFGSHYVPESVTDDDEKSTYHQWVHDGYLIATDGNKIDHEVIRDNVWSLDKQQGSLIALGYDNDNAAMLISQLNKGADDVHDGIDIEKLIDVPQRRKYLSEPMKWVEAGLKAGIIHHDNNPVMNWMMSNVVVSKRDALYENYFPIKARKENKIDGALSMLTAVAVLTSMVEEELDMSFLSSDAVA